MNYFVRLVSFLIVVGAAWWLPWPVIVCGVTVYLWWWGGLEVVPAMILVDAYFGAATVGFPLLSGVTVLLAVVYLWRGRVVSLHTV
jgi:hypothetical protein